MSREGLPTRTELLSLLLGVIIVTRSCDAADGECEEVDEEEDERVGDSEDLEVGLQAGCCCLDVEGQVHGRKEYEIAAQPSSDCRSGSEKRKRARRVVEAWQQTTGTALSRCRCFREAVRDLRE